MPDLVPFANESDVLTLDGLTIENRLDRLSLYGSLQLTRDQAGLALAVQLRDLLNATVQALQAENLPERVTVAATETVDNPFQ